MPETMDIRTEALEIIRDVREYLIFLRETGVDEIVAGSREQGAEVRSKKSEVRNQGEEKNRRLIDLREKIGDCMRCKLWKGRTNIVFGTGNPDARLLFVGEGPGEEEDLQGKPFVGKAGTLLTKMIEAMGIVRDDVFIANVVKCRPPGNRNPEEDEILACKPFLEEQITIIDPHVICALGTFAAQTLLETKSRISELRGKIHEKQGYKIVPTFHPAYLLRNPNEKQRAWKDLQLLMRELGKHS